MKTLIEVKKLNKSFGNKQILKDVSFTINEGEILGFIGPNGAGKTTTIKLMLGLQSIDSGKVIIDGYDIKKDFEKAIKSVGAIVESPDLYMYLSGRENLELIASYYDNLTNNSLISLIPSGSRPFVGSSSINTFGLCKIDAAIPNLCLVLQIVIISP